MNSSEHWRWSGAVLLTFAAAAGGLGLGQPLFFVAGAVPLMYVAYGYLSVPPTPDLSFERHIDEETAVPGSAVTVRLEVTNDSKSVVSDVRVVDGVPGPLPVVDGRPREAIAIPPHGSTTLEYAVRARRGVHEFNDVRFQVRSLPGDHVATATQSADGTSRLRCLHDIPSFPLPDQTRQYVGRASADEAGEGVEFYGSREYQPEDPASRIDWNRLAGTGELTTLVHREDRSRSVVFVLDARPPAAVGSGEGTFTAIELGTYAIERGVRALQDDNHSVGLAVIGDSSPEQTFVVPGGGTATSERIRHVLSQVGPFVADALEGPADPVSAEDADGSDGLDSAPDMASSDEVGDNRIEADGGSDPVRRLLAEVGTETQVVLVSPLLDAEPVQLIERLKKRGYVATVLSPDVTGEETWGARLAALDRLSFSRDVQSLGVPVVDWDPEESLGMALVRGAAPTNTSGNTPTTEDTNDA